MFDPVEDRFGSAAVADYAMRRRARLHGRRGVYIDYDEAGRVCTLSGQSDIPLVGGTRSLKGSVAIPWLVDGNLRDRNGAHHMITLDLKRQDTVVAAQQMSHGRHCYYFNPREAGGMSSHPMNPCEHLAPGSPTLIADVLTMELNWIPSLDPKDAYFTGVASKAFAASGVTYAREFDLVNLPALADKMAGLGGVSEEWLDFEHRIGSQPEPQIAEVAGMLREAREKDSDTGAWAAINNEVSRSFLPVMDGQVRASLSPPFDLSFRRLTEPDCPPCMVSIMEDLAFATTSAPVLRAIFTAALVAKQRAPVTARPQFWLLNEIAHFPWPMAESLAMISAGFGISTAYVVQSTRQLENLENGAAEVIPQSCGAQIYLGTRSLDQARVICAAPTRY